MLLLRHVIRRHLFVEVARTWLVVAGVLLFLTLGLGFAKFIAAAAAGELPVNTVLLLALYSAIENGGIVLPISVLLAVLLTLGRLSRDNEMAAMRAGGAGLGTIYRPFVTLAVVVALLSAALSLLAAPHANRMMEQLTAKSAASALQMLSPGRFRTLLDGKAVFYAQDRDKASGALEDVFIRVNRKDRESQQTQVVITAKQAFERSDPDTGAQILVLKDGWRYEGLPGAADYRIVQFKEHGVRVLVDAQAAASTDVDTLSTPTLLAQGTSASMAELQARLSVPLSILILTLLGLPMGRVPPRAGRYGRIVAGVLLYVVYFNLLHLTKVWVHNGQLAPQIGVWSVHLGMLLLAIGMIMREQGLFVRRRRRAPG